MGESGRDDDKRERERKKERKYNWIGRMRKWWWGEVKEGREREGDGGSLFAGRRRELI